MYRSEYIAHGCMSVCVRSMFFSLYNKFNSLPILFGHVFFAIPIQLTEEECKTNFSVRNIIKTMDVGL